MQHALEILGIPCYHGYTLVNNTQYCTLWNQALDAKFFDQGRIFTRSDWDQLLGDYGAVADLPAIAFAEDFINIYPECKVVLVERDIGAWYKSFNEGVMVTLWNPFFRAIARLDSRFSGRLGSVSDRWCRGWMRAYSLEDMQEKARPKYREHYALVERVTPPERLLKFELKDGWGPLCDFLQMPVPEVPFPRVNEAAALRKVIRSSMLKGLKYALLSRTFLFFAGTASIIVARLMWSIRK